jgi:hypothetical protein
VSRPLREASKGLTFRRASYVVLCTMGTSFAIHLMYQRVAVGKNLPKR